MICGSAGMHLGALPCAIRKSPTLGTSPTILASLLPKPGINRCHSHFADGFQWLGCACVEISTYRLHSTFPSLTFPLFADKRIRLFCDRMPTSGAAYICHYSGTVLIPNNTKCKCAK